MIKYLATAHYDDADISCETYEMDVLMKFLCDHEEVQQDVIDAYTGELLYVGNSPSGKDFIEDQFLYATVGWMCLADADPEPDPREEIIRGIMEVCEEFGATFSMPQ